MSKDRVTLDEAHAGATRAFFGSWFAMLGGLYVAVMFAITFIAKAPIARSFGMPENSAEAYLLDMAILIALPLGIAIWLYMNKKRKQVYAMKVAFLDRHGDEELVSALYNPNTIYRVQSRYPDDGKLQVVAVWNPNGPVSNGDTHITKAAAVEPLDTARFMQQD